MDTAVEAVPNILIVEDESIIARDLQYTLRELGYEASGIAASSEQAFARADDLRPDLVLMDIRIQGALDGIATAQIFRERYDVPVIYFTAHADEAMVARAKLTEPYAYLLKPVQPVQLRIAVEVALHRHASQRRVAERLKWLSSTLGSLSEAVVTVDPEGRVTFLNAAAEVLLGVSLAQAFGTPVEGLGRTFDVEGESSREPAVLRALHQDDALGAPELIRIEAGDGRRHVVYETAAQVREEGRLLGAVAILRDVTATKLALDRRDVDERMNALGSMAVGLAHIVSNPLAVVIGNAGYAHDELQRHREDLQRTFGDGDTTTSLRRIDDVLEGLRDIRTAGDRIGKIVTDLRGFASPYPGARGSADVRSAVEWAVRSTLSAFSERAQLSTHFEPVPPVRCAEARLSQVVANLLINAAQAIEPGRPEANEVRVDVVHEGNRVAIEVRDTGSGIASHVLPHVFEPFFTTKPGGVGRGLGLSICHGIVSSLGGEIEVESVPGQGSTFRVVLPVHVAPTRNGAPAIA